MPSDRLQHTEPSAQLFRALLKTARWPASWPMRATWTLPKPMASPDTISAGNDGASRNGKLMPTGEQEERQASPPEIVGVGAIEQSGPDDRQSQLAIGALGVERRGHLAASSSQRITAGRMNEGQRHEACRDWWLYDGDRGRHWHHSRISRSLG